MEAHHSFSFPAHRLWRKINEGTHVWEFKTHPSQFPRIQFCFSSTVVRRCHEELLERLAKKTAVKEQEVCVLASPLLHSNVPLKFSLRLPQIRWSIHQVLEGLGYLHQKNIAHLDVKVCKKMIFWSLSESSAKPAPPTSLKIF